MLQKEDIANLLDMFEDNSTYKDNYTKTYNKLKLIYSNIELSEKLNENSKLLNELDKTEEK